MWITYLLFWYIGAFIAFALTWMRFTEGKFAKKNKWVRALYILIGTILSWISVIIELIIINKELKKEIKKYE